MTSDFQARQIAAAALAAARTFDGQTDPQNRKTLKVWADAVVIPRPIPTVAEAVEAVNQHYRDASRPITAHDMLELVRHRRAASAHVAAVNHAEPEPVSPAVARADAAYVDDVRSVACDEPGCPAGVGEACVNAITRLPMRGAAGHLSRARAARDARRVSA